METPLLRLVRALARFDMVATLGLALLLLAGVASARANDQVAVGMLRFVSSGPLFLAMERGYFRDQGIDIEPKFFEAAQACGQISEADLFDEAAVEKHLGLTPSTPHAAHPKQGAHTAPAHHPAPAQGGGWRVWRC